MWGKIRTTYLSLILLFALPVHALTWSEVTENAKGQVVNFYLWSGNSDAINYLKWTASTLKTRYQIDLRIHPVRNLDAVIHQLSTPLKAKAGSAKVDLLWLNGLSFAYLRNNAMLYGPFVEQLPNWSYVDQSLPLEQDAALPTLGLEAPWGMGQLVYIYDSKRLYNPPQNYYELLSYARAFPGRITYPSPKHFMGTLFLQALLVELSNNHPALQQPVNDVDFAALTAPLWRYLDDFHPYLWRRGKAFPTSATAMTKMLAQNEIDLIPSFNPNMLYAAQSKGNLPLTTKVYAMDRGALTTIHYLAIPALAKAKEGALVTINFLLSPEAQSRKGMINVWGDLSILRNESLTGAIKHVSTYHPITMPEPSWATALNQAWVKRYIPK